MEQNAPIQNNHVNSPTVDFGSVPKDAEGFRTVPKDSEPFGTLPHRAESFRSVPHLSERKENHTLTVREVARLFESAGVARTERSIVNWCQPNRTGIARLDSYFDPNERRYYISPQSVEQAIAEEKAKATKHMAASEPFGTIPPTAETPRNSKPTVGDELPVKELERENLDLKITNRAKDMVIDQMQKEREKFFDQLMAANRRVGELETKLLQIESPAKN